MCACVYVCEPGRSSCHALCTNAYAYGGLCAGGALSTFSGRLPFRRSLGQLSAEDHHNFHSPVGVERGSTVLHVVGAQVERSFAFRDRRQNSGVHRKPGHDSVLQLRPAAAFGCYGVAWAWLGTTVNFDLQHHVISVNIFRVAV